MKNKGTVRNSRVMLLKLREQGIRNSQFMLNHTTSVRIKYIFRHAKMQIICICMYKMPYKTYFSTKKILHEKTWQKKQWWLSTIWQKHGHLVLRKFSGVSMRGSLWRVMFIEAEFYKGYFITLELIWRQS